MVIHCYPALDFLLDCTLTVPEWMAKIPRAEQNEAWAEFMAAAALYMAHGDAKLKVEPRVGYVPDQNYFIFKENNKGRTFIISHDVLPYFGIEEIEIERVHVPGALTVEEREIEAAADDCAHCMTALDLQRNGKLR